MACHVMSCHNMSCDVYEMSFCMIVICHIFLSDRHLQSKSGSRSSHVTFYKITSLTDLKQILTLVKGLS